MIRSKKKQQEEREEIAYEIMQCVCDTCHYPYILDEDALPAQCDACDIEKKIRGLI